MAAKRRVVVAGSRGVFGSLLVDELTCGGTFDVIPATRETFDLRDPDSVARMARGAFAIACAAGPFADFDRRIVFACVDAGAHWLDIADDEKWFFGLLDDRELDALARAHGVAVISGLSTLPAISGALVRRLGAPKEVELTLFIGNANRKGAAAIASGAMFRTPDRELLRRELGIDAVARTKFEAPFAAPILRLLARLSPGARRRAARIASIVAKPFRIGTRGGWVEARSGDVAARVTGDQRLAILPLVYALDHLDGLSGCLSPSVLDGEEMLQMMERCRPGGCLGGVSPPPRGAGGTPAGQPARRRRSSERQRR